MRRIFEGIVFEEANNAIRDGIVTEEEFDNKRMDEKRRDLQHFILTRFNILLWSEDKERMVGQR